MGRIRSASAHQKVLEAAIALIAERGIDATSMDAVASTSGVSKATIYKHWTDKDALLLEVMSEVNGLGTRPSFDTGNIKADVLAVLSYRPQEYAEERDRILPHFMAYSARNPEIGMAWRNMVMNPPRRELKHLLQLGIGQGTFPKKLDFDLSLAVLLGPILYWFIFLRKSQENPLRLAQGVVEGFWRAFALRKEEEGGRAAEASPTLPNASGNEEPCRRNRI